MTLDTAIALAAIVLVAVWPIHQQLELRALRYALGRQRAQLHQHRRAIIQLQGAATQPPTTVGQPMNDRVWSGAMVAVPKVTATISGDRDYKRHTRYDSPEVRQGGWVSGPALWGKEDLPIPYRVTTCAPDPDPTLRLRRPPALSDIEYVLGNATRPLTRTEIASMLGVGTMDILTDLRRLMLDGRITMTSTHTAGEPGYTVPTLDPTVRLARMPVLPGLVQ